MASEHLGMMRRGLKDDFVAEIPMVCTEVYSDVEAVRRAAQQRGHTTGDTMTGGASVAWPDSEAFRTSVMYSL